MTFICLLCFYFLKFRVLFQNETEKIFDQIFIAKITNDVVQFSQQRRAITKQSKKSFLWTKEKEDSNRIGRRGEEIIKNVNVLDLCRARK